MKWDKYNKCAVMLLFILFFLHFSPIKGRWFVLPSIWVSVIALLWLVIPRMHISGTVRFGHSVQGYAFFGAILFLSVWFLLGVFLGNLSATPYDISILGIVHNVIAVVPAILAREWIRAYAIGVVLKRRNLVFFKGLVITLLFAVIEINFGRIAAVNDASAAFIYIVRDVIPVILKNMFLTMLVYYGGAKPAALYSLVLILFQRTFPFLPSHLWLVDSAIGIAFPILFSNFLFEKMQSLKGEKAAAKQGSTLGYSIALFAAVLFSWFTVGVFPVYPSVVLTGSMEPKVFPGDAILIQKIKEEKEIYALQEGDVINFQRGEITITHRIIEVQKDEAGNVSFRTKGDNNNSADVEIVKPDDIKGTMMKVIPKVGKPILVLKSAKVVPEGVVEE